MRFIKTIGLMVAAAAMLQSCTKVIDIKLKDADKKYVIEATLTDAPGNCNVLLSKTKNFSDDNSMNVVTSATVSITDNNTGVVSMLTESAPGVYNDATLAGISGHTYTLKVSVGGNTFTASSAMPQKVAFDTLYMTSDELFGDINKLANVEYIDPPSLGHCYQARQYVNGKVLKDIFVTNDEYSNGKRNIDKLFRFADEDDKVKTGDTVTVDFLCIDPALYKYWFSLQQSATGNAQSAAPANPVTNIQGGAIGYFTAHTIDTKSVVAD
jgi:hypothetical protein